MHRRTFLRSAAAAVAALAVDPEKLLWTPGRKTIITAPAGGWIAPEEYTIGTRWKITHFEERPAFESFKHFPPEEQTIMDFLMKNQHDYNRLVALSMERIPWDVGSIIPPVTGIGPNSNNDILLTYGGIGYLINADDVPHPVKLS